MSDLNHVRELTGTLHDAVLHSIVSCGDQAIDLMCRLEDGRSASIMLRGVEQLRTDGWKAGNIVLEVEVRPLTMDDGQSIRWIYGDSDWDQAGVECSNPPEKEGLRILCEMGRTRVEITPSYGCFLVAVCATVSIEIA